MTFNQRQHNLHVCRGLLTSAVCLLILEKGPI